MHAKASGNIDWERDFIRSFMAVEYSGFCGSMHLRDSA